GGCGHRRTCPGQIRGGVDPPGVLDAIDTITTHHVTNLLPIVTPLTLRAGKEFQPPVAERHLETEVAHCVGGVISPVLANLYLHYAFDVWLTREFPQVTFERYCDDAVIHCGSERQARLMRDALAQRLAQVGLELHPDKTRIVYCKDADRRGSYEYTAFTFLGYTFRPRLAKNRFGKHFVSFLPAVSKEAIKAMGKEIRSWRIAQRSDKSLMDLARMFNSIVQGWINYYGRFYKSMLYPLLRRINRMLVGWACQKYKRLRRREKRAGELLAGAARRYPNMFAHWRFGLKPDGWAMGAV
ncbi:group II intron maturase-specific domain-containing protein, partial [Actinacidiphila oryziradicis]